MTDRIVEPELAWEWDDGPRYLVGAGTYKRAQKVDPTPCYGHALPLVEKTLAACEAKFPVPVSPTIFCLRHEVVGRTNGWTSFDQDYSAKEDAHGRRPQLPWIVLSGKRIPPHPAVTRYLVAHEYGHVVDNALAYKRFAASKDPTGDQDREYEELRGLKKPAYYGPATWHADPGEVFANDFRILVCGVETEYWPHPGIPRPEESYAVRGWWAARVAESVSPAAAAA